VIRKREVERRAPSGPLGPVWVYQLGFVFGHAALPFVIGKHSSLGTWHARAVVGLGVLFALSKKPMWAGYVAAYIAGAEVFWRMRRAEIPWEFGKYAIVLILGVALVRGLPLRRASMPIAYFLLLVPGCLLTVLDAPSRDVRDYFSFNMTGPVALAVCAAFYAQRKASRSELQATMICLIAPLLSVATIAAQSLEEENVVFAGQSNAVASGGYGPNQVSAALGLGLVAIMIYLVLKAPNLFVSGVMIGLILLFIRQVIITFSRGGLYMAVGAGAALGFFLLRDSRRGIRMLMGGVVVVGLVLVLVLPRIDKLTGGAAAERFSSLDSTGRAELIQADLETFLRNPVLGVGPGLGGKNRLRYFHSPLPHTEWARLLAEHGMLGVFAAAALFVMGFTNLRRAPTPTEKGIVAALLTYGFLFLTVNGMRLAAPSFAIGFSCVTVMVKSKRTLKQPVRAVRRAAATRRTAPYPAASGQ